MTNEQPDPPGARLEPAENVDRDGARFIARTEAPWLRLRFADAPPAGRWLTLVYSASFFDTLVRPLLRFVLPDGHHDQTIAAPLFGRAIWSGYVPETTREIRVSPVNTAGPFGFALDSCQPLSSGGIVARAWSCDSRRTLEAIGAFCTGDRSEARRLLTLAVGSTPLRRYHAWRRQRLRDMDCASLDAPRSDWSRGPRIHFVVFASIGNVAWLRRLLAQLEAQVYPNWSLWVVSPDAVALGEALSADAAPGRLHLRSSDDGVATVCDTASADDLVGLLEVGCVLPFYAPAVVAEHAAARPRTLFFYGDQDALDGAGRYADPRLYPAWSPAFATATDYATSALFVRGRCLAQLGAVSLGDLARERRLCDALASAAAEDIMHIRRVLVTRSSQPRRTEPTASLSPAPPEVTGEMAGLPCATMVIPSKDRPRLLATCLRGLREATTPADFEVVIVDNGSTDSETLALYDSLAGDHRVRVLHRPGPFNFSFLCNEGAHAARAPVVVFLNNDIEIVDRQWLQPLLSWAAQPDVGAVGAKLLYPSGRLQHGGVVVGLAGSTGHIDRGARRADPGYLDRLTVPHEVSAVTGACLVVQKKKFDAIGGFDAEHLPVELNDIDLCLRLDARGWRTIFTPQSVLIHHESASRGRSTALSPKYEPERTFFRSRWGARLRDDPYFHPALSLVSIRTALG